MHYLQQSSQVKDFYRSHHLPFMTTAPTFANEVKNSCVTNLNYAASGFNNA